MEGMYRFQIVAASKGCLDRNDQQVKTALSLCRYDAPKAIGNTKYPVSFGWLDVSGIRFAFYRKFQEKDQARCPGNFSAHIIFGQRHELDAGMLLKTFGTEFWWLHSPDDIACELPELSTDSISKAYCLGVKPRPYHAGRILQELHQGGKRVELCLSPYDAVWSLHTLCHSLPILVNSISFSTYESPEMCDRFHVYCPGTKKQNETVDKPGQLTRFILAHPAISRSVEKRVLDWAPSSYPLATILEELQLTAEISNDSPIAFEAIVRHAILSNPAVFKSKKPGVTQLLEIQGIMTKIYKQLYSDIK
jgi:hypothetical protein